MDGRQRLGAVLVVAGVVLAGAGAVGLGSATPTAATATSAPGTPAPATAAASAAATTAPTTPSPTAVPATPTAAPTPDTLAIVTAFLAELELAIHEGRQESMADRLGQAVIDRYGAASCLASLAAKEPFLEQGFEVLGVSGPAPWDYVTDDLTTTVPDAITVDANVTGPDATGAITTVRRDLHVQLVDGVVRWFTDCGEPISAP
jgi:hypothetical protein